MSRFGLCAGTYQSQSPIVDAEDTINFIPERVESPMGRSAIAMYCTPGTKVFSFIPERSVLGQKFVPALQRHFAMGTSLYEISSAGVFTNRGALSGLARAGTTSAVINTTQMLICSGGNLYVFTFLTNVLSGPLLTPTGVSRVAYSDGFGIALLQNSNTFQLSAINNFLSWPPLQSTNVSLFPDHIVSMIVDHREIVLLGNTASTVYQNVGAPIFPFQPIQGAYVEQGSAAAAGVTKQDNSIFWLSADERGSLVAYRSQSYSGIRISTHAEETAWQKYAVTSDAIAYSYQENGHPFVVWYFPTQNVTWCYDISTQMWHKRGFYNQALSRFDAHHSQNHAFAFGKHLVGDWSSGNIYEMSSALVDDAGTVIRRERVTPAISTELHWTRHNYVQFDVETGFSSIPAPSKHTPYITVKANDGTLWQVYLDDSANLIANPIAAGKAQKIYLNDPDDISYSWLIGVLTPLGQVTAFPVAYNWKYPVIFNMATQPGFLDCGLTISHDRIILTSIGLLTTTTPMPATRAPQIMFSWSDNGCKTFSNEYQLDCGQTGEYKTRVIKRRLGVARQRNYKIAVTDPIPWRFADAYLDATGYGPKQRSVEQYSQSA